jgi:PTH1 family peptidyl-tRNA hydrolase
MRRFFSALWSGIMQAQDIQSEALFKIVVGLGNPGEQYAQNRHNVGFMVLDALAREASGSWSAHSLSRICSIEIRGRLVLLVKPATYMNHSGKAVHALLSALQRNPQDLLLVVDDLHLPFGRIRVRERGTAGGHHGIESVLDAVKTEEIVRVRIGIGEARMPENKADFVLSDFPPEKQTELEDTIIKAGDAVKSILNDGVAKTMALFN